MSSPADSTRSTASRSRSPPSPLPCQVQVDRQPAEQHDRNGIGHVPPHAARRDAGQHGAGRRAVVTHHPFSPPRRRRSCAIRLQSRCAKRGASANRRVAEELRMRRRSSSCSTPSGSGADSGGGSGRGISSRFPGGLAIEELPQPGIVGRRPISSATKSCQRSSSSTKVRRSARVSKAACSPLSSRNSVSVLFSAPPPALASA